MTELQQARALLAEAQSRLADARKHTTVGYWDDREAAVRAAGYWEQHVKAALSWVWDAQQRDRGSRDWFPEIKVVSLADVLQPETFALIRNQ